VPKAPPASDAPEPVEEPDLDESQRRVAEAPADARVIVTAGAGQGKTEVVAARLRHLIDEEGLDGGDDLLVLSFSRAAVAAVRGRLAGDRSVSRVTVRTFDSFASRLLLEGGEDVTGLGFDRRIRRATDLLGDSDADVYTVESLRHVVVDEVQDLVGDRAKLVLALLTRLDPEAGFTVLGDPLQAIYDFMLDESISPMTSKTLLDHLRSELGASDDCLEHHYRARSDQARAIVVLGERMRTARGPRSQLNKIEHHIRSLPPVGAVADLATMLPRWPGPTAILCDTNGQALVVSRQLGELGVAHRLRRPAEQLSVPAWVAVVLGGSPTQHVARQAFYDLVTRTGADVPEDAWRLLKATERRKRVPRELDIVELAARIAVGDVPVDLADAGEADVIVSTVHRAKGLEFENVVFVEPLGRDEDLDDEAAGERARELYVALSRTRTRLSVVDSPSVKGLRRDKWPPKRWIHGYKSWQTFAFEFQLPDVERKSPFGQDPETARKVQELLQTTLADSGLPVEGRLDPPRSRPGLPVYELTVDGEPIALTSESFATALGGRLERAWRNNPAPPVGLGLLRTDGVETAAGLPAMGAHAGVGRWGLWLAPRIGGLAQLRYRKVGES
jgi:DNA helicase-2/ATP-dependent DNA helicase PcrA